MATPLTMTSAVVRSSLETEWAGSHCFRVLSIKQRLPSLHRETGGIPSTPPQLQFSPLLPSPPRVCLQWHAVEGPCIPFMTNRPHLLIMRFLEVKTRGRLHMEGRTNQPIPYRCSRTLTAMIGIPNSATDKAGRKTSTCPNTRRTKVKTPCRLPRKPLDMHLHLPRPSL